MSLFDDPHLKKLKESLSPEDRKKYELAGEYMRSSMSIDPKEIQKKQDAIIANDIAHLVSAVRSGLRPEHLTVYERGMMLEHYGKDWKSKFGFN